ncbi:MAG: LytTR family DNA-binding domain-containing protein [bacterium]
MESSRQKVRCLVVDDEPLAIRLLKSHIEKVASLALVATSKNALQAMDVLRREQVDLMFLDIEMPEITGLDFLKTLTNPPKVIFTTAYRQYAAEGYDLDVIDYLVKPIPLDRFIRAVNRFFERTEKEGRMVTQVGVFMPDEKFIQIRDNKKIYRVFLRDILFVEGAGEYLKVHTTEKVFVTHEPMYEFETRLPGEKFMRIHKSYIAAISRITAFTNNSVHIRERDLPIGRSYKHIVMKRLV